MIRAFAAVLGLTALIAVAPRQVDSQLFLQRYEVAMANLKTPPVTIFSYAVSQAGPSDIEQRHRIYRSGLKVRDETLTIGDIGLKRKLVRIERREDLYAIDRVAPRIATYTFLFLHSVKDGSHLDYVYETTPIVRVPAGFAVDRVTIDGKRFLPRSIAFHTIGSTASGSGNLTYSPQGGYWVPLAASVTATVDGKPARERIAFGDYVFPPSLPPSTFIHQ